MTKKEESFSVKVKKGDVLGIFLVCLVIIIGLVVIITKTVDLLALGFYFLIVIVVLRVLIGGAANVFGTSKKK